MPVELRPGAGAAEHGVDLSRGRVDVAGLDQVEHRAQAGRGRGKIGRLFRGDHPGGGLPGSQRGDGGHGSTGGHAMTSDPAGDNEVPGRRQAGREVRSVRGVPTTQP